MNNVIKINPGMGKDFCLKRKKQTSDEKKLKFAYDREQSVYSFSKIMDAMPEYKGHLVLFGVRNAQEHLLDVVKGEYNLKSEFIETKRKSLDGETIFGRFSWMEELLLEKKYQKIRFYVSSF